MEIFLAKERAYHLIPQISVEVARDRVEQKKINLVSGTLGSLLSRPKPEDIQLVSVESRLEAFWQVTVFVHTSYERNQTYTIPLSGAEIKHVTICGQDLPVTVSPKGGASFSMHGVEHCLEENRHNYTFDGSGIKLDLAKYLAFAKTEITELEKFAPEGVIVVPPAGKATTVVRTVLAEIIKPVKAEVIHSERLDVEVLDINFRPVYAFEYNWAAKNKQAVIEFDALTGDMQGGGKKAGSQVKGMLSRDLVFDVTADAVGMFVPGGSIAVKLVKAAIDRDKK